MSRLHASLKLRENSIEIGFAIVGLALLLPYVVFPSVDDLSPRDVARIAEFQHLRQTVGERVWPAFGKDTIPLALVKGKMEYLFDHPSAPGGYRPVQMPSYPGTIAKRKGHTLPSLAITAITINGVFTALVPDKATFDQVASLMELGSDSSVLEAAMSGGLSSVDTAIYEVVAIHEGFHAFQLGRDFERLQKRFELPGGSLNENAFKNRLTEAEASAEIRKMLKAEIRHLTQALAAEDAWARLDEARAFLETRTIRRQRTAANAEGLTVPSIAAYESQVEWTEGMASYVEGRVCGLAAQGGYRPLDVMASVPDFRGYSQLSRLKTPHLDRASEMASHSRSYVVGAGICLLLDRLDAQWKKPAIEEQTPLEELLRQALERQ